MLHGNLGAQNSVLGGGRYDGLAEQLDSKVPSPGIGFSIGEDRLVMAVSDNQLPDALDLYIAPMDDSALRHAGVLATELRATGASVEVGTTAKLKKAMDIANKVSARRVLIIGEDELAAGEYSLKDMTSGTQLRLSRAEIAGHLK